MRQEHVRLVLEGWALEAVVWDKAPSHRAKSLAKRAASRMAGTSWEAADTGVGIAALHCLKGQSLYRLGGAAGV